MKAVVLTIAALMACALLTLSFPRLMAGIAMIPGDRIAARSPAVTTRSDRELASWRSSRQNALAWLALPEAWSDLSLIATIEAGRAGSRDQRRELLEEARLAARNALELDPRDARVWLRLARVEAVLGEPSHSVLLALDRAITLAPYEPTAFRVRLLLGYWLWDEATVEMREALLEQTSMLAPARRWSDIETLATAFPERSDDMRARLQGSERALAAIAKGLDASGKQ